MPFITFIYKKRFDVDGNRGPYFGKYCTNNSIQDELYMEVKKCVIKSLNDYTIKKRGGARFTETEETVLLGVLSVSSDDIITINSNKNDEIKCFNFYHDYHNNIYINGNVIT